MPLGWGKENTQNELAGSAETKGGILRRQAGSQARDDLSSAGHIVGCSSILHTLLFHIADARLPAIVHVDMLDFDTDRLGGVEGRRRAARRVADPQVQGNVSPSAKKCRCQIRPRD